MQVFLAEPRTITPDGPQGPFALKVVNLGDTCKLRSDYKTILRAEGAHLDRFDQPGFVKCFGVWGAAILPGCAPLYKRSIVQIACCACRFYGCFWGLQTCFFDCACTMR